MVGNVWEWIADWDELDPPNTNCTFWLGGDDACVGGAGGPTPGAGIRGGSWAQGTQAGVFAIRYEFMPSESASSFGFRCGR